MRRLFPAFVIAAFSASLLASAAAEAQTRKKTSPRPLTITPRSFLDSGKVPLMGSLNRYVIMDTVHNYPAYSHQRSRYGMEMLPGRFGAFWPN